MIKYLHESNKGSLYNLRRKCSELLVGYKWVEFEDRASEADLDAIEDHLEQVFDIIDTAHTKKESGRINYPHLKRGREHD